MIQRKHRNKMNRKVLPVADDYFIILDTEYPLQDSTLLMIEKKQ